MYAGADDGIEGNKLVVIISIKGELVEFKAVRRIRLA